MDVSKIESVRDVFNETKPSIVIHAAATKFVDLSEKFPLECMDVNIVGSANIARVAIDKGVETVIGISTDKAAPPIRNIYGLSKSMMEKIFCALNGKSKTKFMCVRYGNVAWSTGSVLCIWKKMLEENNLIKTTGPEMRRYFFTIDEAVELVSTALKGIEELKGKILSREMKASLMGDIVGIWAEEKNARAEKVPGRPGDRIDEYLIGEEEKEFTVEKEINGIKHYIISFNEKVKNPVKEEISTKTAQRLSKEKILEILNNPPPEELK